MFRFESPQYLIWLWFVLPMLAISWFLYQRSLAQLTRAFGKKLSPFLTASLSKNKRHFKLGLQGLCLFLLILSLARPQYGQNTHEVKSEGVELIIVADVSESMLAEDIRPSRLEQSKVDMMKLVEILAGNKIGLVAFAGAAALLSPLTTDPGSLKLFIDSLNTNSVSTQGTSFRMALEEAKSALERGGIGEGKSSAATRVILFLSDGEDQEKGALDYANKLASEGIHIFTVAYGTEKGAPIPEKDSLGYLKGYKKDRKGNTVLSVVKGEELQALATAGHGSFNFASPGGTYLNSLKQDIDKLEKTQFDTQLAVDYDEKFQWPLLLALLVGLLEIFLGERRTSFRIWKGRFEVEGP
jgi:Ca-activated chloride channel family protein